MSGTQLNSLALKDYQQNALDVLEKYLDTLGDAYADKKDYYEFQLHKGKDDALEPQKSSYCYEAWETLKSKVNVPRYKDKKGKDIPNTWNNRIDGTERQIPNISFKVPTGGGKTLLAACSLGRITSDYFKTTRGLVLWVVPSTTIYQQTMDALGNKEHPYRMQLDIESGGRTKILERCDAFEQADVENQLCVMVIMLQSFNVSERSKDARKVFSDTGKYSSFFPAVDDYTANNDLLGRVPNLMESDMLERGVIEGITIKHSLGNVFRLCRPIVIIDEEHKAKSKKAIDNINEFNPKFILEFSATPREKSNTLIDVGGYALKQEQMIKLPIRVDSSAERDWQTTLNTAHVKLESLSKDAAKLQGMNGTYIRPVMVIIAQPKRAGDDFDHVEEIKKYLIDKCQIQEQKIRIKLSGKNEIKDDDLLSKLCPVQYIITKDALREGWDCPFASVLTVLTQIKSADALTQYIGRVLRQPYASETPLPSLNEAYVYCSKQGVGDAVKAIKDGLEAEGMGDITHSVQAEGNNDGDRREKVTATRHDKFKNQIFMPSLTAVMRDKTLKPFDYYRDILGSIDWSKYSCSKIPIIADREQIGVDTTAVDYKDKILSEFEFKDYEIDINDDSFVININYSLLTSQLTDKIPNPFEARRILGEVVDGLKGKGASEKNIALSGHDIVKQIKDDAWLWLLEESEKLFIQKLIDHKVLLKLLATPYVELNWEMGEKRFIYKNSNESPANDWDKNIFQPQYKSNYNGLEKDVASYINQSEAVKWWHRLGVKGTEYAVQGWKRDKIYPDFLIYGEDDKYYFCETKGNHLENPDSAYKQKVFEHLTTYSKEAIGEFKLLAGEKEISFDLVYENEWKEKLIEKGI